jgi:DNA-binding response OmpR family regulator
MVRIAVIDDNRDFTDLVGEALAMRGWETSAHAGTEGLLATLRRETPDAILLDLRIGGQVIGWDLLEQLELDPVLHAIPVIVCSAAGNELSDKTDWLEDRGVGALEKPFDIDDLYRAMDGALGRRRIQQPSPHTREA